MVPAPAEPPQKRRLPVARRRRRSRDGHRPTRQVDPLFPEKISIGEGTVVGWGTKLLTHEAYSSEWHVGPVEIGDDVTLGHSSSTRPGVSIGDGATVAAHSFVDRDVEPGEKVGGTPIERL